MVTNFQLASGILEKVCLDINSCLNWMYDILLEQKSTILLI